MFIYMGGLDPRRRHFPVYKNIDKPLQTVDSELLTQSTISYRLLSALHGFSYVLEWMALRLCEVVSLEGITIQIFPNPQP